MTTHLSPVDEAILLAVAWAAPLTSNQLQRLLDPLIRHSALHLHLRRLAEEELIIRTLYYRHMGADRPPTRVGDVWSLTQYGIIALSHQDAAPLRLTMLGEDERTQPQLLLCAEVLVQLVEQTRPRLSGIAVERQPILATTEGRRRRCDMLITLRCTSNTPVPTSTLGVPWADSISGEPASLQRYAVEIDHAVDTHALLTQDAVSYQQLRLAVTPTWVLPSEERRDAFNAAWSAAWPDGQWLTTTSRDLHRNRWQEYRAGSQRTRPLFDAAK